MKYDLTGEQRDRCFPPDRKLSKEDLDTMFPTLEYPDLKNPVRRKIYVIGSLSNDAIPVIATTLRTLLGVDWEVFDDWHAAHPQADDQWRRYEISRGRCYSEALKAPAARNVFDFDLGHLKTSTHGLLVLPAGRSGHLELGYLAGRGAKTAILLDTDYKRWDVMYGFADTVTHDIKNVIAAWRD